MERINKNLNKEYLTAKLFLEDLEAIQAVLNESSEKFELKTEDFIFSNVEEFRVKFDNQKLNNIEINANNPYISIEFKKTGINLYCGSSSIQNAGVFFKLDSIISKTSRKPNFLYSYSTVFLGNILLVLPDLIGKDKNKYFSGGLVGIIFIIWFIWVLYIRMFNSSKIVVAKRGNFKNFFSRNRDQIITAIITAIITLILQNLTTYFFPYLLQLI